MYVSEIHLPFFDCINTNGFHYQQGNQLPAAACMLGDHVTVHVLDYNLPNIDFVQHCAPSIVYHSKMAADKFAALLSQMDVNLYVTVSEASPMVPLESIVAGVPCLVGPSANLYDSDPVLKNMLVVPNIDRPDIISNHIREVLNNIDMVVQRLPAVIDTTKKRADRLWNLFVQTDIQVSNRGRTKPLNLQETELGKTKRQTVVGKIKRQTVCFCTYELEGVNQGGAGVLISGLVQMNLLNGNDVIVLGDMPEDELREWQKSIEAEQSKLWSGKLSVYSLAGYSPFNRNCPLFLSKSNQWALGLSALQKITNFDTIEFFEYAGAGFEVLRNRHKYVSGKTRIIVRIHGALLLIDLASRFAEIRRKVKRIWKNEHVKYPQYMFLMESFVLNHADGIIVPSVSIKKMYMDAFKIDERNFVIGKPCMKQLLRRLPKVSRIPQATIAKKNEQSSFLFYGSLQPVKGIHLVISAALRFLEINGPVTKFYIIGPDRMCPDAKAGCIRTSIPKRFQSNFEFLTERIKLSRLPKIAKNVKAAIFPSFFETFCISAHELYALKIPLIVSSIPAFQDYFDSQNSFTFLSGSMESLASVITESIE